jgi:AAA+ ATPase superfamily predicted ATPase
MPVFNRPTLAKNYARVILKADGINPAASGLFLSAPRRVGKSTFVREDLRPALEEGGAVVIYVDLWDDTIGDPGQEIVKKIRQELIKHNGVVQTLAQKIGVTNFKVANFQFDLNKVGLGGDSELSLKDALEALSQETKKMIVLIIDEAQQTQTSKHGESALFALKAARDELNSSKHHGLRVVCTGSNRAKLALMTSSKDQPFFGAQTAQFQMLDLSFVKWFCDTIELPFKLHAEDVMPIFEAHGYRPEILLSAAGSFALVFDEIADEAGLAQFKEEARIKAAEATDELMRTVHNLTPLQSAVLKVMAFTLDKYAPFEANTIELYKKALSAAGASSEEKELSTQSCQSALSALQEKKLVWKAARGTYYLEEVSIADTLRSAGLLDFA